MKKEQLKEKAIQLYEQGLSLGKIAQQLGVGKTTVHTWINNQNGERTEKNVPDVLENEMSEINKFKNELQNEFGAENDVQLLVALKKAQMEHVLQMERLELERERMLGEQKLKSEQLIKKVEKLEKDNRLLSSRFDNSNTEKSIKELDKGLSIIFKRQIDNFLDLEDIEITLQNVENVLEEVELLIRRLKKWIRANNQTKSDYIEFTFLKKIRTELLDMAKAFDKSGEEELIFSLDPAFKRELEEW